MNQAEERPKPPWARPRRLAAGYLAAGILWLLATKLVLPLAIKDLAVLAWGFVISPALFLLLGLALLLLFPKFISRLTSAKDDLHEGRSALPAESLLKAVESMQLGLTIADTEGRIIYANPSEARMHGYEPGELVGQDVQIYSPEERKHHLTFEDLKRLKRWRRESVNLRKDGSTFPVQLLSDTVIDAKGRPLGVITTCEDISERKAMERSLRESEERYRHVVEGAAEMIVCLTGEGRISYANRAWIEAMGYTAEESARLDFFALIDEDSKLGCHQALAKALAGTAWQNLQLTLVASDGHQIPAEGNLTSYHREGRAAGAIGIFRDITYRKQIDLTLRKNEKQFRLLIKNALDIIMILNRNGTIRYTSPSAEGVFGRRPEELLAKPLFSLLHPEDLPEVERMFDRMRKGELPSASFEVRGRRRDGSWRSIQVMANNTLEEPSIEGIVLNARDVTEQSTAREKLAASEERFRYLANSAADAIITVDEQGSIIFWNKAAETIFGYSAEQAIREKIDFIIPKRFLSRTSERLDQLFAKTATGSGGRPVELMGRRQGGIEFPVELSFSTWVTREGSFLTAIIRDISERKEAERQLKYLSFHDPLTGLYNRAYFEEEMSRMEKSRFRSMGLILADVDGLKLINDTMGHKTGDGLLVVMAGIIKDNCRLGDMVARIGGDEFAVLLPNCEKAMIDGICQRIRETTSQYSQQNPELPLSLSVGYAVRRMEETTMSEVYREADNNMYREKVKNHDVLVKGFIEALERRNLLDPGKAAALEELMLDLAIAAGVPHHRLSEISLLARYHDIGCALQTGEATGLEEEQKRHPEIGYHIAMSTPYLSSIADWILKHHECWNGKGYPLGIRGEDIPLESRILSLASAYIEAAGPPEKQTAEACRQAVAGIRKEAGKRYDPKLAEALARMMEKRISLSGPA
jgi:diguanylate cyclase (GGDEF)-like protein/PAS domain S-box-containing protein